MRRVFICKKISTLEAYIFLNKNTVIGYISWKILEVSDHSVLVLPEGWVGYEILINEITFASLSLSEEASLYIHHHINEAGQTLFGFISLEEKSLFTELIKISGVGWKVALQILSLWKNRLISAVQQDDKKTIESIKGIGKKMAEKIVLELKDKDFVKAYIWETEMKKSSPEQILLPKTMRENITTTLMNMGYQPRDIERVISELPEEYQSVEEILPFMIRELS